MGCQRLIREGQIGFPPGHGKTRRVTGACAFAGNLCGPGLPPIRGDSEINLRPAVDIDETKSSGRGIVGQSVASNIEGYGDFCRRGPHPVRSVPAREKQLERRPAIRVHDCGIAIAIQYHVHSHGGRVRHNGAVTGWRAALGKCGRSREKQQQNIFLHKALI
jgi:hypothetical protein